MVLVNGTPADAVPSGDRGLAYGDGVFRTFPMRAARASHWTRHYAALSRDCARLGIACPAAAVLERDLAEVSRSEPDCVVKVIITRGTGERGYRPSAAARPLRAVMTSRLPEHSALHANSGIRTRRCRLSLGRQPALAGIKHLNRLENVLARAEWRDDGIAEGLLGSDDGQVIGGTMSNLFIVEHGQLVTPDLACCGVAGVTRERVIDACANHGMPCHVDHIGWPRFARAEEAFVVNSLIGLWPIREFEGAPYPTGPVAQRVLRWLEEDGGENS